MVFSQPPQPIYLPGVANPAYHLRYLWTGWLANASPSSIASDLIQAVAAEWETDGIRLLEVATSEPTIQLLFSCQANVSPRLLAQRAKGRLQHVARKRGVPVQFSRKFSVRAIGDNTTQAICKYIQQQVQKESFVDPQFAEAISRYTHVFNNVNGNAPIIATRGRYWYHLHAVLVTAERYRLSKLSQFQLLHDRCIAIANKKSFQLTSISVMPDHLHLGVVGAPEQSPEAIVLTFQNNLAYAMKQTRIWMDSYYVGTSGEFDIRAVRRRLRGNRT